jgi:hypothetical protein
MVLGVLLNLLNNTVLGLPAFKGESSCCFFTTLGFILGYLPFLSLLFRPSAEKLESLLGAIPEIRDPLLRKTMGALAREVSELRGTRRDIQVLAQGVSVMEAVNSEELVLMIRASDEPYIMIRLIGHLDTPLALYFFEEILKLNNYLSFAALRALESRTSRLRNERTEIIDLLWAVWENRSLDGEIRSQVRWFLLSAGEHPPKDKLPLRSFMFRSLKALAVTAGLAIICKSLPLIFLVLWLGIPPLIWWDARRIGARWITGYEENTPLSWAILSFCLIGVPLYFLTRDRIRRDAVPVDWDEILQAIQAKETHGDRRRRNARE